jgi:hypothetical protein
VAAVHEGDDRPLGHVERDVRPSAGSFDQQRHGVASLETRRRGPQILNRKDISAIHFVNQIAWL